MMECQRAEEAGINDGGENCDNPKPLLIKQRVVWFDDEGSSHSGCIKWIGKLHEMGDDLIAGVELDEAHGKNDGRWGSLRLFTTRPNHGLIVPVTALMKEEEFFPGSNCDDSFYSLPKTDYVDCRPKILTDTRNKVECSLDKMDYAEKEQFSYPRQNTEENIYGVRSSGTYALQVAASIASGDICSALILRSDSCKQKLSGGSGKEKRKLSLSNCSAFSTLINSRASSFGDTLKRSSKEKKGIFSFFQWFRRRKLKKKKNYCFPDEEVHDRRRSCSVHSDTSISNSFHYVPMAFSPMLSTGNSPIGDKKLVIKQVPKNKNQVEIMPLQDPLWKEKFGKKSLTVDLNSNTPPVNRKENPNSLQHPVEKSKHKIEKDDVNGNGSCISQSKLSVRRSSTSTLRKKKRRAPQPPLKRADSENEYLPTSMENDSLNKKVVINLRQMARLRKKRRAPSPPYKSIGINTEGQEESDCAMGNDLPKENKCIDTLQINLGNSEEVRDVEKFNSTQGNREIPISEPLTGAISKVAKTNEQMLLNDLSKQRLEKKDGELAQACGNSDLMNDKWKETNVATQKLINMFNGLEVDSQVGQWNIPVCNGAEGNSVEVGMAPESGEGSVVENGGGKLMVDLNETVDDNSSMYSNLNQKTWSKRVRNLDDVAACIEALTTSFSEENVNEEKGAMKIVDENGKMAGYSKNGGNFQELRIHEEVDRKDYKSKSSDLNLFDNDEEIFENAPVQGKIFRPKVRRSFCIDVKEENCASNFPIYASPKKNIRKTLDLSLHNHEEEFCNQNTTVESLKNEECHQIVDKNTTKNTENYDWCGARPRYPQKPRNIVDENIKSPKTNHVSKIRCNIAASDIANHNRKSVKSFSASFNAANTNKSRSLDSKCNRNPNSLLNEKPSNFENSDVCLLQQPTNYVPTKQARKHRKHCPLPSGKTLTQPEFLPTNFKDRTVDKFAELEPERIVPPRRSSTKKHRREIEKMLLDHQMRMNSSTPEVNGRCNQNSSSLKFGKENVRSVKNTVVNTVPNISTCSSFENETPEDKGAPSIAPKSWPSMKNYKQTPIVNYNAMKNILKGQLWPLSYEILAPELLQLKARLTGQQILSNSHRDELLVDDKNAVEINKLLMQLELAISNGFVEKASYLARKLAELKIKCSVVRKKAPNLAPSTGNILINLYVEDSTSHIGPITLEINPSMTVGQLKRKIEQEFDFPSCLQRWILGKKLANDDNASISSFDITSSGCAVFLYLTINDGSIADMYKRKLETYLQAIEDFDLDEVPNNDEDNSEFYDCVAEDNVDHNYSQQKSQIKVLKSGSSKAQEDLTRQFCIEDRVVWYNNGKPEHGYICYVEPPGSKNGIVVGVEFDREITFAPGRVNNGAVFSQYKEYGDFLIEDLFHEEDGACQNFDKSKLKFQNSKVEPKPVGWNCPSCTYVNVPTWPGCRMCGTAKPQDYVIPPNYKLSDEEKARLRKEEEMEKELKIARDKYKVENYQRLVDLDNIDVVLNDDKFECVICYTEVDPGDGVRIRECLHTFCRDCIANVIEHSETAEVKCPYLDDKYSCPAIMQDREIRALVSKEIYERHLQKSIALAENQAENSFHCKTANCAGWCFYDDNINEFICPVCSVNNCLTCQAIHEGYNCKQYQDKLEFESVTNVNARKTKEALDAMLAKGEAMKCPKCQIIIQKKIGCDWLCCTMCRTEICWVTKGPRWGPLGKGDISGGCKCGVNQVRCHPNCGYCH